MSQYWKENSLAIADDDNIIWIQSAVKSHDEPIVLRFTSCDIDPKKVTHIRRNLTLNEAKSLVAMLQDIVEHQEKMQNE